MISLNKFTLVPRNYKHKDPRSLAYFHPTKLNLVSFMKQMQIFSFNQALEAAENVARIQGKLLLPSSCMHWQRAKDYMDRRVKIGRHNFYLMEQSELTKTELQKLQNLIE